MASSAQNKMSREDWRKQKELDDARKAGSAPAEVDEEGRDINPHIPQYISNAPWYYGNVGPTLRHQRALEKLNEQKKAAGVGEYYQRGRKGKTATRYRKGACENCGAMTHKKRDCVERPRKLGAKYTGKSIASDEVNLGDLPLDFDGKRDRWNGYDVREHTRVIEEYEKIEAEKRRLKAQQQEEEGETKAIDAFSSSDDDSDSDADADAEEKGYAESANQPGTKFDTKRRFTVRNLRIREDTAKYLRNLDVNSAYYDPKTRTMRSDPYAEMPHKAKDATFAGDNFVRYTGDVGKQAELQLFAWEATNRGTDVHVLADPTKAELMHKEYAVKRDNFQNKQKSSILEKYGGQEHLQAPPKELLLAQTENYVEYSQSGRLLKGKESATVRSRYEEDVYPGNHSSVWGSFWDDGKWGYACCHSLEHMSYCAGKAGIEARSQQKQMALTLGDDGDAKKQAEAEERQKPKSLVEMHQEKEKKKKKKKRSKEDDSDDEDDEAAREKRIRKLMKEQAAEEREAEKLLAMDERDQGYSKKDFKEVTEEDMEAYRRKRQHADDPMKAFL